MTRIVCSNKITWGGEEPRDVPAAPRREYNQHLVRFFDPAAVTERLKQLFDIIKDEEDRLTDFRKSEAPYLALSDDELAELEALIELEAFYEIKRSRGTI